MLNPKFHFFSPISTATTTLAEHVDHAIIALDGRAPIGGDRYLEQLSPVSDTDMLRVELWVSDLGDYTCTYGFVVSSENGSVAYARGERTVVNIDPRSHAPQKWTREFRSAHADLIKDLPAYA
jgi:acyl-CoA thioesterase FadM